MKPLISAATIAAALMLGSCAAPYASRDYDFIESRDEGLAVRLQDGRSSSVTPLADERFTVGEYVWLLPGGRSSCGI